MGIQEDCSYKRIHAWEIMSLISRILDVVGNIKDLHERFMRNYDNRKDLLRRIDEYLDQEGEHFNVNLPFLEFLLSDMKGKFEDLKIGENTKAEDKCQIMISALCHVISCIKIHLLLNEMMNM